MTYGRNLVWSKRLHWEKYLRPRTIAEALDILEESGGEATIIAGGTDLIPQIRNKEKAPKALVDITRIPGLNQIKLEDGLIKLGALVTHNQVAESSLIREKALALSEGASILGSPQIRNVGTVVGNVINGQPGADTSIPLLALDAGVEVVNKRGERRVSLLDFFITTGKTAVDSNREMVTEISFSPLAESETSVFLRVARRKALALPVLTLSIVLSADLREKVFNYARIALGPVAPVPFRAQGAEKLLSAALITDGIIRMAGQKAAQESNPRTSLLRGSQEYRRAITANLVERGIREGIKRLEGKHA